MEMKNLICLIVFSFLLGSFSYIRGENSGKMRILTCGIRHESNTFSTLRTGLSDFRVLRGQEVLGEKHLWSDYLKNAFPPCVFILVLP